MVATVKDATTPCESVLRNAPHFQIPGLNEEQSIAAVCKVAGHLDSGSGGGHLAAVNGVPDDDAVARAVMLIRRTAFPELGRRARVVGENGKEQVGLQHVVSADNGAAYWELWHLGGPEANWYAVTGADPENMRVLQKAEVSPGIPAEPDAYEIPGVYKGMPVEGVVDRFLQNFLPVQPQQISKSESAFGVAWGKGGCGCGGKK